MCTLAEQPAAANSNGLVERRGVWVDAVVPAKSRGCSRLFENYSRRMISLRPVVLCVSRMAPRVRPAGVMAEGTKVLWRYLHNEVIIEFMWWGRGFSGSEIGEGCKTQLHCSRELLVNMLRVVGYVLV